MIESSLIRELKILYSSMGNEWVKKNSFVLNTAKLAGVALGGSIAMAITRKKVVKEPGDMDFFTDDIKKAEDFVKRITKFLDNRDNTYYNIRVNNKTSHCLEGVKRHYRIVVPFWLPICVMVLDKPIRQFYWNKTPVQYFDDVVKAAKKATLIDGKERVVEEPKLKVSFNTTDFDLTDLLTEEHEPQLCIT